MKSSTPKTPQADLRSPAAKENKAGLSLPAVSVLQQNEAEQPAQPDGLTTQLKENKTGMPDQLKSGIESLSGMSMDHVKVHYNSSQPAQLSALAYAQGSDIHIGPGQEKHLPHEAWHVVQQAQGRVQPTRQMKASVPVNDDPGLEQEADVMGAKAMQMKFAPALHSSAKEQNASQSSSVFQMKRREAVVTWGVTHLVKAQAEGLDNESLFGEKGKDGWKAGELPVEEGELSRGQPITVDDELIFMSRRGRNQENEDNRLADGEKEMKHKWNLVLAVGEVDYSAKNAYIRSETIELANEPKEIMPIQTVEMTQEDLAQTQAQVTEQLTAIKNAWADEARNRKRNKDQVKYKGNPDALEARELSSGWNWDQFDEGEDVAEKMARPDYREFTVSDKQTNLMVKAHYQGESVDVPIAFLMMEEDTSAERPLEDDEQAENFFYIRWLVGHPVKKGGGTVVMNIAKQKAIDNQLPIYVEVAYSATDWYKKAGFQVIKEGKFDPGHGYGDTLLKYTPPAE